MAKVTHRLKKSFSKAQKPAFDFDAAVAEAYKLFPHIDGSVFFVNAHTGKVVHPDPALLKKTNAAIRENAALKKLMNKEVRLHRKAKSSSCLPVADKGGNVRAAFVFLYMEKDLFQVLGRTRTLAEEQQIIFDHELAHVAIPDTLAKGVKSESVADVYAALRHFQRCGTETGAVETLMQRRAALCFFHNDAEHFTCQALETALSFKDQFDFKSLKPHEIANMASYIGTNGTIGEKELKSLSYHFNKLKGIVRDAKNDRPLRDFAERVFSARAPHVHKWGKVALQAFLDQKIHLCTPKRRLSLRGPYWDNLRHAM